MKVRNSRFCHKLFMTLLGSISIFSRVFSSLFSPLPYSLLCITVHFLSPGYLVQQVHVVPVQRPFQRLRWWWGQKEIITTWNVLLVNDVTIGKFPHSEFESKTFSISKLFYLKPFFDHKPFPVGKLFPFKYKVKKLFPFCRFCVGDKFYLLDNRILCEYDYEDVTSSTKKPSFSSWSTSLEKLKRQTDSIDSGGVSNPPNMTPIGH